MKTTVKEEGSNVEFDLRFNEIKALFAERRLIILKNGVTLILEEGLFDKVMKEVAEWLVTGGKQDV